MGKNTKGRVLVVDDEDDLRVLLSQQINSAGYDVSTAADGEEAINTIKKNSFDVVLLDINMPKVNGIEVLKFIHKNYPKIKAVMLTGFADLKHAMEAREFGARDFIGKPYKLEDVMSTIDRLVNE